MLRPAEPRVALCNTGCCKLQDGVLHVAARRVASCNTTCCTLQRRLLQVVARIGAGCRLSGCRLQHRALQVAARRVARCNTACCSAQHRVCCAQHDATPHVAFLSPHVRCVAGATFDASALVQPSLRAAQRLLLATATPTAAPGAPSNSSQRSRPLHGRARRRWSAAPHRSPGYPGPLHARVWSAHRRAVDRFSVGTYTFTCATDCAATTCTIDACCKNYGGTLPDVFHRLTCASKITRMCAPSARAAPRPVPICVLVRRRKYT
jgi:hypothetical protein